jgi:hypothetical protein
LGDFFYFRQFFYFGRFLSSRSSPNFGANFSHSKSDVFILTKNRYGYILDDFFTSLSVQPDLQRWRCLAKSGIAV